MRTLVLCTLAATLLYVPLHSQETQKPLTESGNSALNFQIAGLGEFGISGPFAGSTTILPLLFDSLRIEGITLPIFGFGFKTFLSDQFALRGTLGANYSSETTRNQVTADSVVEQTDDMLVAAIAPGFEYHFAQAGPVTGYVGAMFSYTNGFKTTGPEDAQQTEKSTSLFVGPILGAEFFPWDNVSLGAEYVLGMNFISTSVEVGDVENDGPSYTNIGIGNFAVKASLYFK